MIQADIEANATALKLRDVLMRFRRHGWRQNSVGGLTTGEIIALFSVKRAGEEDSAGAKVSDISNIMNVAPPTVTQQLNNLEKQGYIERKMDKEDRRVVRVSLTEEGVSILQRVSDELLVTLTGLVEHLGEQDSTTLTDLLARVSDYFQGMDSASVQ